jgi:hypothetical protein
MPKVWNIRDPDCPSDAYYIGRPGPLGNPFPVGRLYSREEAIRLFDRYVDEHPELKTLIKTLRGRDLKCFCKPKPCHGDIILRIANDDSE